jgi:hypothetical protein
VEARFIHVDGVPSPFERPFQLLNTRGSASGGVALLLIRVVRHGQQVPSEHNQPNSDQRRQRGREHLNVKSHTLGPSSRVREDEAEADGQNREHQSPSRLPDCVESLSNGSRKHGKKRAEHLLSN